MIKNLEILFAAVKKCMEIFNMNDYITDKEPTIEILEEMKKEFSAH